MQSLLLWTAILGQDIETLKTLPPEAECLERANEWANVYDQYHNFFELAGATAKIVYSGQFAEAEAGREWWFLAYTAVRAKGFPKKDEDGVAVLGGERQTIGLLSRMSHARLLRRHNAK